MKKTLIALSAASVLFAGNTTHFYELTPTVGGVLPEGNTDLRNSLSYGLRLGVNTDEYLFDKLELALEHAPDVRVKNSNEKTDASRFSLNIVKEYDLAYKTSLYALVGLGYEFFEKEAHGHRDDGFGNYGLGLKYAINDSINLIADVRHAITFSGYNNLFYTLGLSIPFGAKATPEPIQSSPVPSTSSKPVVALAPIAELDSDNDGVPDRLDKCPNTPAGVKVDEFGCELDSDGDGVVDSKDKCPGTPAGLVVDKDGCVETVTLRVMFGFDKANISPEYMDEIKNVADFLKTHTKFNVKLEGHTDNIGSKVYNQNLSNERAIAVLNALKGFGIEKSRMSCEGFGEENPIASNEDEEGRALNRRVEAKFRD